MPKISIIIPVYNRLHLLERAINSVLNQTVKDFQLIIADDASTDNVMRIVKQFSDHRIFYIRHDINKGASAARNTGIENASGDYIALLDSDDEWFPQKLEKQITVFQSSSSSLGVVYTGYQKINYNKNNIVIPNMRGNLSQEIFRGNLIGTTSTPLIRKDCLSMTGLFDETLPSAQDWDMWIRIAQHYEFDYVPEVLVRYHLQHDSITMDNKAKIQAYKVISKKYNTVTRSLPIKIQAEHYSYMGKTLWYRRNILASLRYFIHAFLIDPLIVKQFVVHLTSKIRKAYAQCY